MEQLTLEEKCVLYAETLQEATDDLRKIIKKKDFTVRFFIEYLQDVFLNDPESPFCLKKEIIKSDIEYMKKREYIKKRVQLHLGWPSVSIPSSINERIDTLLDEVATFKINNPVSYILYNIKGSSKTE